MILLRRSALTEDVVGLVVVPGLWSRPGEWDLAWHLKRGVGIQVLGCGRSIRAASRIQQDDTREKLAGMLERHPLPEHGQRPGFWDPFLKWAKILTGVEIFMDLMPATPTRTLGDRGAPCVSGEVQGEDAAMSSH